MDDESDDDLAVYGSRGRPSKGDKPRVVVSNEQSEDVPCSPAILPDPRSIPPRQWLLGTQLLRGFVSVLVAPGGTGKTIYAMTAALSLAVGHKYLGLHVWQRVRVWVINEDPIEELNRRLAAIMIRHKVEDEHVSGWFFLNSMDDRMLDMASRGDDGFTVIHPDEAAIVRRIRENNIGLLVVDPFAESHSLEENSNPDMIKAAGAWRRVARSTGAAIFLVHHVRKPPSGAGANASGIDAARGAKGLTDSARVGLVMSSMTEDEADKLSIAKRDRLQFVRVDDGKVNLSPRVDEAKWFKLEQVDLHNGTDDYPHGDKVAALVPWTPPKLFSSVTNEQITEILDDISQGAEPGVLYAPTAKGKTGRWVGYVLCRVIDCTEEQAQLMVDVWFKNGVLAVANFTNPKTRKVASGVIVCRENVPDARGLIEI